MIYGLVAESDISLPELSPSTSRGAADIRIVEETVTWPPSDNCQKIDDFLWGRPGEIWMNVPGKLAMRITAGRTIAYQPHAGAAQAELRAFLLGSALGALLLQRGHLVLHANAIGTNDGSAIVCVGESGAGKTTTAAAMMQRGYQVLADDVCSIAPDGFMHPGLTRIKLWDDAAVQLGIETAGLDFIPGNRAKWNVPLDGLAGSMPYKPVLLILLDVAPVRGITVSRLNGRAKFEALRNNIYRPLFNQALGIEPQCLARVSEVFSLTRMYRVSRPTSGFHIDSLVETILELQNARGVADDRQERENATIGRRSV